MGIICASSRLRALCFAFRGNQMFSGTFALNCTLNIQRDFVFKFKRFFVDFSLLLEKTTTIENDLYYKMVSSIQLQRALFMLQWLRKVPIIQHIWWIQNNSVAVCSNIKYQLIAMLLKTLTFFSFGSLFCSFK